MFENLNITGAVWSSVKNWLRERHPDLLGEYGRIYFTKNRYWDNVEKDIEKFCREQKLDFEIYFHHRKYYQ
jgi:hypothetical protein